MNDTADYFRELTRTHTHREHYTTRDGGTWYGSDHVTSAPALIVQLQDEPPAGNKADRSSGGYASRPAARLDALDCVARIDLEAAAWVRDLGEDDPGSTVGVLTKLHGLYPSADGTTRKAIDRDVKRWWTQARVITGWDSAAWRPDNTCPMCATRGTLRVKLADQIGLCVECHDTWDHTNIGLLADHIRAESSVEKPAKINPSCWCPWPAPPVDKMQLCKFCGSARCGRVA